METRSAIVCPRAELDPGTEEPWSSRRPGTRGKRLLDQVLGMRSATEYPERLSQRAGIANPLVWPRGWRGAHILRQQGRVALRRGAMACPGTKTEPDHSASRPSS